MLRNDSSINVGKTGYSHAEYWNLTPLSHPITKNKLEMDKRPQLRTKVMKYKGKQFMTLV
jgi:hypothetical protein